MRGMSNAPRLACPVCGSQVRFNHITGEDPSLDLWVPYRIDCQHEAEVREAIKALALRDPRVRDPLPPA